MKKFYTIIFLLFAVFPFASFAGSNKALAKTSGSIIIQLDESNYTNININQLYVVFDKYDRTGAGVIKQIVSLNNGEAVINNVPEGKYYVDVYTAGAYRRHFSMVMKASNKVSKYKLVLDAVVYIPSQENEATQTTNATANSNTPATEESIIAKN